MILFARLSNINFCKADLLEDLQMNPGRFDTILCQRTIHYLPHSEAQRAASLFFNALRPGGCLFISASGMESELGVAYSGFQQDVTKRFHRLSTEMAAKHGIKEPVCLRSFWNILVLRSSVPGFLSLEM